MPCMVCEYDLIKAEFDRDPGRLQDLTVCGRCRETTNGMAPITGEKP